MKKVHVSGQKFFLVAMLSLVLLAFVIPLVSAYYSGLPDFSGSGFLSTTLKAWATGDLNIIVAKVIYFIIVTLK